MNFPQMSFEALQGKYKILAIDDNENNLKVLKLILEKEGYEVHIISDGGAALQWVRENKPDLVLLDVLMPDVDGFEICRQIKAADSLKRIPVIIITALNQLDDRIKGIELGADEFLTKPINKRELLARVTNLLKFKKLSSQLESTRNVIMSFAFAVDLIDPHGKGHSKRVGIYSVECAKLLGLSQEMITEIEFGAYLHDLGKIGIPSQILQKTTPLSEEEYEIYKRHVTIGYEICAPLGNLSRSNSIILHHHERFDGLGFPDGLAGDKIPLGSQIVAIADSFDIMTHGLIYREHYSIEEAIELIQNDAGMRYNPDIVKKFVELPLSDLERLSNVKMFN